MIGIGDLALLITFLFAALLAANPLCEEQVESPKEEPKSAEERLWSQLKGIPIGPLKLDLGGELRLRGEGQNNFNIKKYGEGKDDAFLLERFRVEVGLHFFDGFRLFLQGQDAHEFGCNFSNTDFPNGSPYNNAFDLRQGFLEWTGIGDTPLGISAGDLFFLMEQCEMKEAE